MLLTFKVTSTGNLIQDMNRYDTEVVSLYHLPTLSDIEQTRYMEYENRTRQLLPKFKSP